MECLARIISPEVGVIQSVTAVVGKSVVLRLYIARAISDVLIRAGACKNLRGFCIGLKEVGPLHAADARSVHALIVVLIVLHTCQTNLLEIALTGRATCVFPRSRKDGKKNGREDRYNRNYD